MATQLIEKIRSGSLTEQELINLYNNVRDKNAPEVIAAIERQMRGQFPRVANRLFGKQDSFARQRLEEVLALVKGQVNLDANALSNGVKTGGLRRTGDMYVEVYISYRNAAQVGVHLIMEQDTIDSELFAVVVHYKVGIGQFRNERKYTMDAFSEAAAEYVRIVKEVASIA